MSSKQINMTTGKIILFLIYLLHIPAAIFLLSGDFGWVEGWIFSLCFISMALASSIYLYRRDPALLAERLKRPGQANQEAWDRYVYYAIVVGFYTWLLIMPLDAKRFGWTAPFPAWLKVLGGLGLAVSNFFLYRAATDNPFLSPLVRIQAERHHRVISTGVYGVVRHPMYLGAILLFLGAPLLLGSGYGILLGLLMTAILIARIIGEERMLLHGLAGYDDYRKKVRYRLIPFVW